ncbi:MAG TPA: hypothetical protein VG326_12955 [Tepidisphaeraceae bacterium]|nr:hypothetical protein [Tepidisphaeraceae bacterium]
MHTVPFSHQPGTQCEVHILIRGADVRLALWAIKSFYTFSEVVWPLVWHQGGPIDRHDRDLLSRHFPNSRFVAEEAADSEVTYQLEKHKLKRCADARRRSVMMRKLLDCLLLSAAENVLLIDSDILFFRRPDELIHAGRSRLSRSLFNRDCSDWPYNLTPEAAKERHCLDLVPRLNAGLCLFRRESLPLTLIEEFLADPDILSDPWWTEQTLHALLASRLGCDFLPETYMLSFGPGMTTSAGQPLTAKHYANFPRPFLYDEGMRELIERGFISALSITRQP